MRSTWTISRRNPLFIKSEFSPFYEGKRGFADFNSVAILYSSSQNSLLRRIHPPLFFFITKSQSFIHQVRILSLMALNAFLWKLLYRVAILYSSSQNSLEIYGEVAKLDSLGGRNPLFIKSEFSPILMCGRSYLTGRILNSRNPLFIKSEFSR